MWDILYNRPIFQEERIIELSILLKDLVKKQNNHQLSFSPNGMPLTEHSKVVHNELTDKLYREARGAGLSDLEIEEIFGDKSVQFYKLKNKKLSLYSKIVPMINRFFSSHTGKSFTGYKQWKIGQPLQRLDLLATLQRSQIIIPNVTTISKQLENRGAFNGKGKSSIVLVIDDSYSTKGGIIEREKEAAFAVIESARVMGDMIGCVVYGHSITKSLPISSHYDRLEEEVCKLSSDSGGTVLTPALQEAVKLAEGLEKYVIMIMTDAEIADYWEMKNFVNRLPDKVNMVAFCFNGSSTSGVVFGKLLNKRFRAFSASPDQPFIETALEEIYGATEN